MNHLASGYGPRPIPQRVPLTGIAMLLAALVLSGCDSLRDRASILYHIGITDPADNRVEIRMEIDDLPAGADSLHLHMAERYAYVTPPEPLIAGEIQVRNGAGEELELLRITPYSWVLPLHGERKLWVRYDVELHHRQLPGIAGLDEYEQPCLTEEFGLLSAGALLLIPGSLPRVESRVRFSLPQSWALYCPWPSSGENEYAPKSIECLYDDLIGIGAWDAYTTNRGGCELTIALAPGQDQSAYELVSFVEAIVDEELALFDHLPAEKYLLLFNTPNETLLAGSAKSSSLILSLPSAAAGFSLAGMSRLIAHEFHHTWVASLYVPPAELRFFNEGFTDYYAYQVCARLGIISGEKLAAALGEKMNCTLRQYNRSQLSLIEAGGECYFTDKYAYELVYRGGLLLAALLDLDIRALGTGRSLDDFMRDFNNDPRRRAGGSPRVTDLLALVEQYLDPQAAARYGALISEPWALDPVAEFGRRGVIVSSHSNGVARDMRVRMRGGILEAVAPCGPAGRVGLRRGDRVLKVNGLESKDDNQLRGAWWQLGDGTLQLQVERAGEVVHLAAPRPEEIIFEVSGLPWPEDE